MSRNTPPGDPFEALRRLYNCNWSQLAARLGMSERTLRNWRKSGPGEGGKARLNLALQTALRCARTPDPGFHVKPEDH